jgi:hypothetical protein
MTIEFEIALEAVANMTKLDEQAAEQTTDLVGFIAEAQRKQEAYAEERRRWNAAIEAAWLKAHPGEVVTTPEGPKP